MNFGTLKDIFTERLIESYSSEDKSGKDLYKKYLKILKESETLKTAFIVFKNLESKTFHSDSIVDDKISANEYLKESISLFEEFKDKKSLNNEIKKLTSLLESCDIEYKSRETKKIHRDLQNLITTPKSVYTLNKLQEAKDNAISWLITQKETINESDGSEYVRENVNPKKFLDIVINKFNEKYKESLSEEEKDILKVLRENNEENTKNLVDKLVKETITLINNHLDNNDNITIKEKLLETKDIVYGMYDGPNSSSERVLKLYELKKDLSK